MAESGNMNRTNHRAKKKKIPFGCIMFGGYRDTQMVMLRHLNSGGKENSYLCASNIHSP